MLPQETSVRQLKKLRAETKGTDIGDLTKDDRLNHNVPNLQYIGNPIDTGIESWQEFCQKDSSVQTIAFKSKLVNKPIVKENKTENMKDIKKFEFFDASKYYAKGDVSDVRYTDDPDVEDTYEKPLEYDEKDYYNTDRQEIIDLISNSSAFDKEELEHMDDEELNQILHDLELDLNDDIVGESVKTFEDFNEDDYNEEDILQRYKEPDYENRDVEPEYFEEYPDKNPTDLDNIDEIDRNDMIDLIYDYSRFEREELENMSDEELENIYDDLEIGVGEHDDDLEESVKTFESFSVPAAKKEEKQPEYTILGQEKETKSNPNFGIGAVKAQEIKKISDFNLIDPPTPKERTIGGSAGVFIDNGTVKGFVNRIEGKDAYIESVDDPMVIKKFSLKDVVKTKKQE